MKTAWFVDDDVDMVRAIRLMLEALEYEVQTFFNARKTAKALIDSEPPDILLIDIMMPQVSGIDLLKFIRENRKWDRMPTLVLSAVVSEDQVEIATREGADGFVFKPVTLDELEMAISLAVENRTKKFDNNIG